MKHERKPFILILLAVLFFASLPLSFYGAGAAGDENEKTLPAIPDEEKIIKVMHTISSHTLYNYVLELCSEKYAGRLTGTSTYNDSAQWTASLLEKWGIKPAGDNGTFFQEFPNPYTLVFEGSGVSLFIPVSNGAFIEKPYRYETDYLPGATSGTGEVKAQVIYVGYGITAPELDFDEYKGMDVKGKIVLIEREVPVSPSEEPEVFKKWRSYSFHQYKIQNAYDHGAAGVIFNYPITNPNGLYIKGFQLINAGKTIIDDIFAGTGKSHKDTVKQINKSRKPVSFNTKKIVSLRNKTEHHPEGIGRNVIGFIEGSDPVLKNEIVIIGAHLDHLGLNHLAMPGANDNASGVAAILGVAEAIQELRKLSVTPQRTIVFIFFGAEEQGVKGSEYYLQHPLVPHKSIKGFINFDGVGRGDEIDALAAKNYPQLWEYFDTVNQKYLRLKINPGEFHNRARPRLDAAHFMWAGIPSISFNSSGGTPLPYDPYHKTLDNPSIITPEIMEDLAQLVFLAIIKMTTSNL